MDANSLLFSIGSAMAGQSQSQASSSSGIQLLGNGVDWQGLSLTDAAGVEDFSSVLKAMLMAKVKGAGDSGSDLEKIMLKITEKDNVDNLPAQELLSQLLMALVPQLTSQDNLMLKLKSSEAGAGNNSSDEALLKQKIVELLGNIKEGNQVADILAKLTEGAKGAEVVKQNAGTGSWKEVLAEILVTQLKANIVAPKAVDKTAVEQDPKASGVSDAATSQTGSTQAPKATTEDVSLYDKLLSLSQRSASETKKSSELLTTAQAYGLQSEGMLSKTEDDAVSAKSDVYNLDSKYMTLPKSENLVKELNLALGFGKKGLDKNQQDFSSLGAGGLFIKNLEGSLDSQALKAALTNAQVVENVRAQEVVDQVAQKIHTSLKAGVQEALVELRPEHLGKALMKVSLENGKVSVRFEVSSNVVKEMLESNFSMLKDSLRNKGFSMENFSVSVNADTRGSSQQPKEQYVQPQAHGMGWLDDSESEMEVAGVSTTQTVSAPNYYVEQALVNYLI